MCSKDADGVANSVELKQSDCVCTVYLDLSDPVFKSFVVCHEKITYLFLELIVSNLKSNIMILG